MTDFNATLASHIKRLEESLELALRERALWQKEAQEASARSGLLQVQLDRAKKLAFDRHQYHFSDEAFDQRFLEIDHEASP